MINVRIKLKERDSGRHEKTNCGGYGRDSWARQCGLRSLLLLMNKRVPGPGPRSPCPRFEKLKRRREFKKDEHHHPTKLPDLIRLGYDDVSLHSILKVNRCGQCWPTLGRCEIVHTVRFTENFEFQKSPPSQIIRKPIFEKLPDLHRTCSPKTSILQTSRGHSKF